MTTIITVTTDPQPGQVWGGIPNIAGAVRPGDIFELVDPGGLRRIRVQVDCLQEGEAVLRVLASAELEAGA